MINSFSKHISNIIYNKKISIMVFLFSLFFIIILYTLFFINIYKNKTYGITTYVVATKSMEPTINVSDAIVVKRGNEELEIGDIITFSSSDPYNFGMVITHRIMKIYEKDGLVFYKTKGDNNNNYDNYLVSKNRVYGKVIFKIPYIGILQNFISTTFGFILVVILPALYIIVYYVLKLIYFNKK